MKTREIIKNILVLCAGIFIGAIVMSNHRSLQAQKDLEVAKVLSDINRFTLDNLEEVGQMTLADYEDLFYDYIYELEFDPNLHITHEDVLDRRYCYCY